MASNSNNKAKYIVPDLLLKRFNTPRINTVWTIDDTSIILNKGTVEKARSVKALFVIDMATRKVLSHILTFKDFSSRDVIHVIEKLLVTQNVPVIVDDTNAFEDSDVIRHLIIHTDQGKQFTTKKWLEMGHRHKNTIRLSMSPKATPQANGVSERFNRTFKYLDCPPLKEFSSFSKLSLFFKQHDKRFDFPFVLEAVDLFIKFYNEKHIVSQMDNPPGLTHEMHDKAEKFVKIIPTTALVRSDGPLEALVDVHVFKQKVHEVYKFIQQMQDHAILDTEDSYLLQGFKHFLTKTIENSIESSIQKGNTQLAAFIDYRINSVQENLKRVENAVQQISEKLNKRQQRHITLPLRDPILKDFYEALLDNVYVTDNNAHSLVRLAQMRISTVILYTTGARVNEIRGLLLEDLAKVHRTQQIKIIQDKTQMCRICVLPENALYQYVRVQESIDYLLLEKKFKYLGACLRDPEKPMSASGWLQSVNGYLREIQDQFKHFFKLDVKYTSHSFRIGYVTRILTISDIYTTSKLVGHKHLNTTARYDRFTLNNAKNKGILNEALNVSGSIDEISD